MMQHQRADDRVKRAVSEWQLFNYGIFEVHVHGIPSRLLAGPRNHFGRCIDAANRPPRAHTAFCRDSETSRPAAHVENPFAGSQVCEIEYLFAKGPLAA